MNLSFYSSLAENSLAGKAPDRETCLKILGDPAIELLPLLHSAFEVRKARWGRKVQVHVINNAQNGHCPEDCHYCAQSKPSGANIEEYPLKPEAEILAEAKRAYQAGAYRYCMVFAGRGPSMERVQRMAGLIRKIKATYPIRICLSAGLLDRNKTDILKAAGLDRLNHNLNTSERFYPEICTTHTYQDRLNTLQAARGAGIEICSGVIAGMGESQNDLVEVALALRELESPSIPVNFLVPIPGNKLDTPVGLTPEYCLRILCLFRFVNPRAEVRTAAGREGHLKSLQSLCLYPSNSIFLEGYLNTKGQSAAAAYQMITDGGFELDCDEETRALLQAGPSESRNFSVDGSAEFLKSLADLRPALSK